MARRICILTAALMFLAACGDDGPGQNNNACPEGFEQREGNCVPIFDECPGPAEIPVLGGGCQPVGVTECATGFLSDGEGGCDPILPSEPCPAGTMEMIGETECRSVGVPVCATGFVSDGEGGCDAVLPSDPCPFGTMEVLGFTACQPIGDCGTGTWGNITIDATTVFVDASADATGADGSDASPFVTIGGALAVVEPGGQIAVAEGEYVERLLINRPVELVGRCAELVTIRGRFHLGQNRPPVAINVGGSGTTIRGVTLTGDAEGLVVTGATSVTVDEVQVVDTGSDGVWLNGGAQASFRRVVVGRCTRGGVYSYASRLELDQCVVRDTRADADGYFGRGIHARCSTDGVCGSLSVTASLVAGNREVGIASIGVDATVTSTVVRETLPEERTGMSGMGIAAQCDEEVYLCGSLSVAGSLFAGNRQAGIFTRGVDAAVTSTVVRDTLSEERTGIFGQGIVAQCTLEMGVCGSLSVAGSLVAGNRRAGIYPSGVDAVVTSTVVRDNLPRDSDDRGGHGLEAQCDEPLRVCSNLSVARSLVEGNTAVGIVSAGADVTLTSTVVRDTLPDQFDLGTGRGIAAQCDERIGVCGSLNVVGSVVSGNREVGIFAAGADLTVTATVVRDGLPRESDGTGGTGIVAQCDIRVDACGSLNIVGSVVSGNRELGVFTAGVDATVTSTVVRDTLPQQADGMFGRGINAECYLEAFSCGSLSVAESLVTGNENAGVFIYGVPASLEGVAVTDTRTNDQGPWSDEFGQGIWAVCYAGTNWCPTLEVISCLVDSSRTAGVAVKGAAGFIESSVINSVAPRPLDDAYGYGIQVEGLEHLQPLGFDVRFCVIREASLAGVMYSHARGAVSGTSISGGQFAVVANVGSSPEIADDSQLSGTTQDGVYWGNMDPAPAPAPALPVDAN